MKAYYWFAAVLISGMLCGCSNDDVVQIENVKEIKATLKEFKTEESLTRTAYNISEQSGFQTLWAAGDVLGIYPIGGDQVSFPISDGVGTTIAKFDGGSWALRGNYKYAAYYPFSTDCYTINQEAIPVNFVGQVQTGNNTTTHLAGYDFMAAAATQPSSNGSVDLAFNHVGCFLRMQLTMPEPAIFTELTITAGNQVFSTKGVVNLSQATPSFSPVVTTKQLSLGLMDVRTTNANQEIVLYMMVAPDDLSDCSLSFCVKDNNGNKYSQTAAGKKMIANYAYSYALQLDAPATSISGSNNNHYYVDLGLPSGLKWATCNIGANYPDEYGLYFAWGEVLGSDSPDKQFGFSDYKWINGDMNSIIKYCTNSAHGVVDNKTELDPEDDAARYNWQSTWRMPTKFEVDELITKCSWNWGSQNLVNGLMGTGPNGNIIFFPAAGYRNWQGLRYEGSVCHYWSSSLSDFDTTCSWNFYSDCNYSPMPEFIGSYRESGYSIRPVCVLSE